MDKLFERLPYIIIGILVIALIGGFFYSQTILKSEKEASYAEGWNAKSTVTKIETVRVTIRQEPKKAKPVIPTPEYDSLMISFVNSLILDRDDLEQQVKILLEPREFFVGDSMAYARILYFPVTGLYEGELVHASINTELTKVKEPPLVDMPKEKWYEDPTIFIAGGATGIAVVAGGASAGVGAIVVVAGGIIIAIF